MLDFAIALNIACIGIAGGISIANPQKDSDKLWGIMMIGLSLVMPIRFLFV